MQDAVRTAAAAIEGVDLAAVELAATYAAALDDQGPIDKIGPLLLATLEALLMTPRARAATVKGGGGDSRPGNPLDELRARRAARVNDSPAVDSAAT